MSSNASSRICLASSIQAVLVMDPVFIRLAPGVFGLQEHVAALSAEGVVFPGSFFSPPNCRYYMLHRRLAQLISCQRH
jgi:hypothetical protein